MNDPGTVFASISIYMVTVIAGLFIHGCILLPLIYWIITRGNIWVYTKNLMEALLIALATASR
jgi:solute carrier family 1 (glutamate transporter) protein 7